MPPAVFLARSFAMILAFAATSARAETEDLAARAGLTFDAQVEAFSRLTGEAETAVDAQYAEAILAAAPFESRLKPVQQRARAKSTMAKEAGGDALILSALAAQQAGDVNGVALSWRQQLGGDASLNNALQLHHASGPIDAQLAVTGRVSLVHGGPMALSYASSAYINVLPVLQVGAVAQGPLGTLADIHPHAAGQSIGPEAKLSLPGLGGALAAETGWRMPLGPEVGGRPVQPGEFRWKLTFQKKL